MSPPLPVISGKEAIQAFEKIGYKTVRQRGSHVRLRDDTNPDHRPVSIPLHRELDRGLIRDQIRRAGLTVQEFLDLL